jgi:GTPase SAR1 family protein
MDSKKAAVLTIAGPQRSGKSFLSNRFVDSMKGFAIGPTVEPCTKGIWIWSKPMHLTDDIDLIILDTEGLNSV